MWIRRIGAGQWTGPRISHTKCGGGNTCGRYPASHQPPYTVHTRSYLDLERSAFGHEDERVVLAPVPPKAHAGDGGGNGVRP